MLAVENLGKRFGGRTIFRNLTFALQKGDALIVQGRNGSGKSTLLKIIAGLLAPSEGKVHLPPGDHRNTLGLSALDLAVYPHLTVEEHLLLCAELRGCEPNADTLIERVGLAEHRKQFAGKLSTGLRNRLKLALALQPEPLVLLLDEPGASLDAAGRANLDIVAKEQRTRGVLVVATNDPDERRLGSYELSLG